MFSRLVCGLVSGLQEHGIMCCDDQVIKQLFCLHEQDW
jgi:hypothetical protein